MSISEKQPLLGQSYTQKSAPDAKSHYTAYAGSLARSSPLHGRR